MKKHRNTKKAFIMREGGDSMRAVFTRLADLPSINIEDFEPEPLPEIEPFPEVELFPEVEI